MYKRNLGKGYAESAKFYRLGRYLDPEDEERLREFFEAVMFLSDDCEGLVARNAPPRWLRLFSDRRINPSTPGARCD
jgi:hypothetical protein